MGLLQRSAPPRMCLCLHSIEINARIKGKRVEIPNSQVLFPRGPFLRGLCGSGSPLACADIAAFALLGTLVYVAMAGTSAPWPWPEPPGQRKNWLIWQNFHGGGNANSAKPRAGQTKPTWIDENSIAKKDMPNFGAPR